MAFSNMKSLPLLSLLAISLACEGANPWFDAIKAGDTAAVTRMLDAGADIEARNEWDGTALAEAVWSAKQEVIPILLARGANPNTSGQYGTPLCLALDKWDTIAIRMLLEDPRTEASLARRDGATPIHLIEFLDSRFNPSIIEALIKRGADINAVNKEGKTPLMRCCWTGADKWAAFLVKHGANIHLKNANGETAYAIAAQRGQLDIMKILEEGGGKVPVLLRRGDPSKTPLSPAQQWVLATCAILNQRNGENLEALIPASFSGDDRASAIRLLKRDWGITGHEELIRNLTSLENSTDDVQFLAWNLCRHANVAQWGVKAGYINEAPAWERMLRVAHRIQGTYKSWAEMSESYLAGRRRWYRNIGSSSKRDAQNAQPQMEFIVQMFLNAEDPNSPWTRNKWETDLNAAGAAGTIAQPPPVTIPKEPVPIANGEWKSTMANCLVKIPATIGWKVQANEPAKLSLQNGSGASFHILCYQSKKPEITPEMAALAKANSKANDQASGLRSEVVSGDWLTFRGIRAYQWVEKQWPADKPSYFSTQRIFIRQGRSYLLQASSYSPDPFKDPAIEPLISALRFLDE